MKIDNVSHLTTPGRIDQAKNKEKVDNVAPQGNAEAGSTTQLSRAGSAPARTSIMRAWRNCARRSRKAACTWTPIASPIA